MAQQLENQSQNKEDMRLSETSEYSVREYRARLKLLAAQHSSEQDLQEYVGSQMEWTEAMNETDIIHFEERGGTLYPVRQQTLKINLAD